MEELTKKELKEDKNQDFTQQTLSILSEVVLYMN